jgi:threonine synthase
VKEWMTTMEVTAKLDLDDEWLSKLQNEFRSARITDEQLCDTIQMIQKTYDYVVDPHTAVALAAAEILGYEHSDPTCVRPVAILATASPCKFEEAVTVALGKDRWTEYCESSFPAAAKNILNKQEIPPVRYPWKEGLQLTEVQIQWETLAMSIIQNL